ncbi:hypothetical protein [Sphingomonas faeni]|uniref:hypothetical protein n=1 Tax=Sphingomonas faeni TaxID=185950 RepID=UPI0020C801B6|nr:hypothetical protein [Sphingomonas faeni]MCP8890713.1 hypothetical protein [Sphingomonas faeni]
MNFYFILFLLYVVSPKISLVGEGAPVRPEDLISIVAIVAFIMLPRRRDISVSLPVKLYCVFIFVNFASVIINFADIGPTGLLYAFRLIQYLAWYFILYEACHEVSWLTMRRSFIVISSIFIIWGVLEASAVIPVIGKFAGATQRLTINTSGPFETSVMLAMLAYAVSSYIVAVPLLVLVFFTQSRVTLVGMVVSYFSSRPLRAVVAGMLVFVLYPLAIQPLMNSLSDTRIGQSESPERMANVLIVSWQRAPVLDDPSFFRERLLDGNTITRYMVDTKGDMSFRLRAVRWPTLIKSTFNNPLALLIGWSPGAWSNALDNYYVRIFGETGLIGLVTFLIWLGVTIKRLEPNGVARYSLIMMAVVGVFIDIFTSSKVMPLLWAFIAFEEARHPFALPQKLKPGEMLRRPRGRWLGFGGGAAR